MTAIPSPHRITVHPERSERAVSPHLYGLFLEDINFACDGGLNANLVNNFTFTGAYLEPGTVPYVPLALVPEEHREELANTPPELLPMPPSTPAGRRFDPARHWTVQGGSLEIRTDDAIVSEGSYARLTSDGVLTLDNPGYPGGEPSMGFSTGRDFRFSAALRSIDFEGVVEVQLIDRDGTILSTGALDTAGTGWSLREVVLTPSATALGALRIVLRGSGSIDLDEVTLIPGDHWGAGDSRWSQGVLRRDLVEALAALAPRFLRFPGGCIVEGCGGGSHYKWKDTVGPIAERTAEYNLWGQRREDGDYSQSYQVGFYEYFLLCEDLGMEPIPVVWSGDSCQTRMDEHLPLDSEEFAQVVQDAVDLIDWATGDPATSALAALRAEAGHPAPFPLTYIGVGNENFGPEYLAHFARIKRALDEKRDGLQLIVTGGVVLPGESGDQAWATWKDDASVLVDEHFYNQPSWFFDSNDRYDTYPRGGARVFLGEYAAHTPYDQPVTHPVIPDSISIPEPNTWLSALSEAAFLTGVERNSDIVAFSCYAPLFNLTGHGQWQHNLIDFSPSAVIPTANYLVQQLFGTRIGSQVAAIESDAPSGVFVSATTTDDVVHVKLVNINQHPVDIELSVDSTADGDADAVQLCAALDAVNRLPFDGQAEQVITPTSTSVQLIDGVAGLQLLPASVLALSIARS